MQPILILGDHIDKKLEGYIDDIIVKFFQSDSIL